MSLADEGAGVAVVAGEFGVLGVDVHEGVALGAEVLEFFRCRALGKNDMA